MSVQLWISKVASIRAQLVLLTAKKLELFIKLDALAANSNKWLETVTIVRGVHDCVKGLVWYMFGQSVESLDASVNEAGVHQVNWFLTS